MERDICRAIQLNEQAIGMIQRKRRKRGFLPSIPVYKPVYEHISAYSFKCRQAYLKLKLFTFKRLTNVYFRDLSLTLALVRRLFSCCQIIDREIFGQNIMNFIS